MKRMELLREMAVASAAVADDIIAALGWPYVQSFVGILYQGVTNIGLPMPRGILRDKK